MMIVAGELNRFFPISSIFFPFFHFTLADKLLIVTYGNTEPLFEDKYLTRFPDVTKNSRTKTRALIESERRPYRTF